MSIWTCSVCSLNNFDTRDTCQACFNYKSPFHFLPKEIEEIIFDYRNQLEISETREKLNKEFKERVKVEYNTNDFTSLTRIIGMKFIRCRYHGGLYTSITVPFDNRETFQIIFDDSWLKTIVVNINGRITYSLNDYNYNKFHRSLFMS